MKKVKTVLVFIFFVILSVAVYEYASAKSLPDSNNSRWKSINQADQQRIIKAELPAAVFQLPASLSIIEDGAFEGTALTKVDLPENVETIGDNAFANIPTLKSITIPKATTHIGKNAFIGSDQVTITAIPQAYSRTWAKENGIPFIPIISFYAFNTPVQITGLSQTRLEQQRPYLDGESTENKTLDFTYRMTGEIKADEYERKNAYHIQGRSPPTVLMLQLFYYPTQA